MHLENDENLPLEATTTLRENVLDATNRQVTQLLDGTRIAAELKTLTQDFIPAGKENNLQREQRAERNRFNTTVVQSVINNMSCQG